MVTDSDTSAPTSEQLPGASPADDGRQGVSFGQAFRFWLRLGFINFAHWSLFDRVPAGGPRRGRRRLKQPYVLFQSNFNGPADLYIDAFSLVVRGRIWLLWGGAYGYPGARPMEHFRGFILEKQVPTGHYWSAYPDGSSRMVVSALRLRDAVDRFGAEAAQLPPDEFAAAYRYFLGEVQAHL